MSSITEEVSTRTGGRDAGHGATSHTMQREGEEGVRDTMQQVTHESNTGHDAAKRLLFVYTISMQLG